MLITSTTFLLFPGPPPLRGSPQLGTCSLSSFLLSIPHPRHLSIIQRADQQAIPILSPPSKERYRVDSSGLFFVRTLSSFSADKAVNTCFYTWHVGRPREMRLISHGLWKWGFTFYMFCCPESSFRFFHKSLQRTLNKLFGQPNILIQNTGRQRNEEIALKSGFHFCEWLPTLLL